MNWLGGGLFSFLAAAVGALLGAFVHFGARRHGIDFPPIVGVFAGLAAALASRERSGLRGALVASLAVWAAALAEVLAAPRSGVLSDMVAFHQRLGLLETLAYAACAAIGVLLASRALRRASSAKTGAAM